jgi:DNA-binding response OmpR family regulator
MTKKLLIIEDDKILSEMYTLKFTKEGFEVESAYNGIEGLAKVASFNPDAILLDIMMPTMNGFDTLQSIKSQTSSNCKIIIFTNIIDKDKINEAIKMWADDYLIKADTTPKDAVDKVNEYIEKQKKDEVIYVKPGLNNFKIKNPDGGEDIEVEINIKL